MDIYAERLKQRIEWAKQERNLTQDDIADLVGVGRTTLRHYWTRGGTPPSRILIKLAEILEVDLNWLFGRDQSPEWPKGDPVSNLTERLAALEKKIDG